MSSCIRVLLWLGVLAVVVLAASTPVRAQESTPWPTPIVTDEYIIRQEVTYGEGGVIVALVFVAGVSLLNLFVHLGERVTDR
jgi:hypothetical protein